MERSALLAIDWKSLAGNGGHPYPCVPGKLHMPHQPQRGFWWGMFLACLGAKRREGSRDQRTPPVPDASSP